MAPRQSVDRQTFLKHLLESGLLTAPDLERLQPSLPDTPRGRVVARFLVERGILTRFQAERILAGKTGGFILGQYRILEQLGKGGMGRVFKAVHKTLRRTVAIKVLAPQAMETERAQALFQREMQAAAQLMHPNVVTAYDANHVGGRYYLVMEFVDGPNLDALVRKQGLQPVELACELMRQAAEGLQYAADMGMVHRDIKPSNLLVVPPGGDSKRNRWLLKITDFGLARLQSPGDEPHAGMGTIVARPNIVMGTPDFVSPEQARDLHAVDIRSDLYSLGCSFYYLLSGKVPFPGCTTIEKLVRHSTAQPTPIEKLRSEVPLAVAEVVRRLMAKDPAQRFQTPAELARALEPFSRQTQRACASALQSTDGPTPPQAEEGSSAETFATPSPESDAPFDFSSDPGQADELSALQSTWPPDAGGTLLADTGDSEKAPGPSRMLSTPDHRLKIALGIALGLGALLLLAVVLILAS